MSSRLILADAAIHPWPFPALDIESKPEAAPEPADANGHDDTPEPTPAAEAGAADAEPAAVDERADEGYAAGWQHGYDEGCEQGRAAGRDAVEAERARLAAQTRRLTAILDRLGEPIAALQQPVEEAVAALALEIARCVIGGEVARSREYLVRLIREAVAKVPIEMGPPRVLLNPADLDLIRQLAPDLEGGGAALVADEAVEAGGCLVVADGDGEPVTDRRWRPRAGEGVSQVNLTLSSRWRSVILSLFDGEED